MEADLKDAGFLFRFNPKDCDRLYFKELLALLNAANPDTERYIRTKQRAAKKQIEKMECTYPSLANCEKDEFFFNDARQILLGRYFDTFPCFYMCDSTYFIMSMDTYSFFKNDIFIRYMIDKPNIFLNGNNIKLETVFPVRILLSRHHKIPSHKTRRLKKSEFNNSFIRNTIQDKFAISNDNLKLVRKLPADSLLRKMITAKLPINHVIARELCILYFMDIYFYAVYKNDKPEPFLLCSKYSPKQIRSIYSLFNRPMPNIKLYMHHGPIRENNQIMRNICLKYDFTVVSNNTDAFSLNVKDTIPGLNIAKFDRTLDYLWNYIAYFYIFVCDGNGKVKGFFFQNRNERSELVELLNRIKNHYGRNYAQVLEKTIPNSKVRVTKEYYKLVGKECNQYCDPNYHVLPVNKVGDWVIQNPIVWAHGHSYKASDYYGSTLLHMFKTMCHKYKLTNKVFFVNYMDGPVLHKRYKYFLIPSKVRHDPADYYPIYSPNTTEDHADIPIPYPDSWESATQLRFGDACRAIYQDKPIVVPFSKKRDQIVFRGTNTSRDPNDPAVNTRLFILSEIAKNKADFPDDFFDTGLTGLIGSTFLYPNGELKYSELDKIREAIPDFSFASYLPMKDQSAYKYQLEMEGIAAAWRLHYMMQFNNCIINIKSKFIRWFEKFPEFETSVINCTRADFIKTIRRVMNDYALSEKTANNAYAFWRKYMSQDALITYLHSVI